MSALRKLEASVPVGDVIVMPGLFDIVVRVTNKTYLIQQSGFPS